MSAPGPILQLVERFQQNAEAYKSGHYNETQLRLEFVNPFFKCLGWDMDNVQGYAEAYKDVIHEDAIKVGGVTKAPDYCFRIGGTRKFFLEAKKPSVNIKDDPAPAYQLRRYAWSAKMPLSILTDFEEFAVYDCRVKPDVSDKASAGRTLYLIYSDYSPKWDDIAGIFSREAILKGSFDKYAESRKGKRGTATVDAAFLEEIEKWRDLLAKNLASRNPSLTQRELNYAVQVTIDRIIFLRMCEDRGIENYGQLQALLNGPAAYGRLLQLFRNADDRYNSGLFYFHKEQDRAEPPDELTPALKIDDKPLKEIIQGLYYPDSPYEFSVLPAEILGHVYEQFLGKVIRLTAGHQAKVEDKPEVKKAGGVYYTPTYIVHYIVKHTVGKLLGEPALEPEALATGVSQGQLPSEPRTIVSGNNPKMAPKQASKVRILDPACGSGSFLLGAYRYLLDWHRDWYVADGPDKHTKEIYQGPGGVWRLTTAEKKRILLNNIYGVDIDPQAVEVTKLSLLLKVLEGESKDTLERQRLLFHERALPDLASNIKCGNSLIGPDFYEGQQLTMFDDEERYRINVFDWNAAFPKIMKVGGFDAVIGNPPYIRIGNIEENLRPYLYATYHVNHRFDIYVVFVQRAFELLNGSGNLGFIVPNKFFTAEYGKTLREYLASNRAISSVVDFGDNQVFEGPTTYTCLLFLERRDQTQALYQAASAGRGGMACDTTKRLVIDAATLGVDPWTFVDRRATRMLESFRKFPTLGDQSNLERGLETGSDDIFLLNGTEAHVANKSVLVSSDAEPVPFEIERAFVRPVLKGSVDIRRYFIESGQRYVLFPYSHVEGKPQVLDQAHLRKVYPLAWQYLSRHRATLRARKGDRWYEYRRRNYDLCAGFPRLLVPSIGTRSSFAYDREGLYHFVGSGGGGGGGYGVSLRRATTFSMLYLLGLLNSRLLDWLVKLTNSRFGHGYYSFNRQYIQPLPIRPINFHDRVDKARHDHLVQLVENTLSLHQNLAVAKTSHEKAVFQNQIEATDREIDRLVYELYALTEEEIKIVEGTV